MENEKKSLEEMIIEKQTQLHEWGFYIVEDDVDAKFINDLGTTLYKEYFNARLGARYLPRFIRNRFSSNRFKLFITSNSEN